MFFLIFLKRHENLPAYIRILHKIGIALGNPFDKQDAGSGAVENIQRQAASNTAVDVVPQAAAHHDDGIFSSEFQDRFAPVMAFANRYYAEFSTFG